MAKQRISYVEPSTIDDPEMLAEFFVSLPGLGMYILAHARSFAHNEAVVGVIMLAAFGLGFEATMNWAMRRYFPWYRRDVGRGD